MAKLNLKKRDSAQDLLEDHQKVTDALSVIGDASYERTIFLSDDHEVRDFVVKPHIAKRALTEQKDWIEGELKKLGIELT